MLAYLTCVTGIIGTLAVSFFIYFSAPDQPITPAHAVATVAAPGGGGTIAAAATPGPAEANAAGTTGARTPKRPMPTQATTTQSATAFDLRPRTRLSALQLHRLLQDERARRLAYRQSDDFETRFLSYTD